MARTCARRASESLRRTRSDGPATMPRWRRRRHSSRGRHRRWSPSSPARRACPLYRYAGLATLPERRNRSTASPGRSDRRVREARRSAPVPRPDPRGNQAHLPQFAPPCGEGAVLVAKHFGEGLGVAPVQEDLEMQCAGRRAWDFLLDRQIRHDGVVRVGGRAREREQKADDVSRPPELNSQR